MTALHTAEQGAAGDQRHIQHLPSTASTEALADNHSSNISYKLHFV